MRLNCTRRGAVPMADGYARIAGKLGVVSLQTNVGLANGLSQVRSTKATGTPLLVCACIKDTRIQARTVFATSPDIQESVKQHTKWDRMVLRTDAISENVTRALTSATSVPSGMVFLALPEDSMTKKAEVEIFEAKG